MMGHRRSADTSPRSDRSVPGARVACGHDERAVPVDAPRGGEVRLTWEEFLHVQQAYDGPERICWDDGRIVMAMTGGTERHDLVTMHLGVRLGQQLQRGPCRVFVHHRQITTARRSYYPDLLIRCGRAAHELYEDDAHVVVEVLSPSNGPADLTRMLFDYRSLPSIETILFIDTRRRVITVHERSEQGWSERQTRGGEVRLGPATVDLDDLWVQVDEQSTFD